MAKVIARARVYRIARRYLKAIINTLTPIRRQSLIKADYFNSAKPSEINRAPRREVTAPALSRSDSAGMAVF
jgi:hypothetical protein